MKGIKKIIYKGEGQLSQATTLYPSKCINQTPEYEEDDRNEERSRFEAGWGEENFSDADAEDPRKSSGGRKSLSTLSQCPHKHLQTLPCRVCRPSFYSDLGRWLAVRGRYGFCRR
jgi:hypothetical protein